jgi:serine/threonine protein kinase
MSDDKLTPSKIIGTRYQLQNKLGAGGMGEVWKAQRLDDETLVALKFLKPNTVTDGAHAARFVREARLAAAVRHPNVVRVHEVLQLPVYGPVIVMDYLRGEDLAQLLRRRQRLTPWELATVLLPVLDALQIAHAAGVVHRDLKPENIFLDGGIEHPRLLDFGIAKLAPHASLNMSNAALTETGALLGTPHYMSPEQIYGEKDVDSLTDVWAVGVIAYEILSGRRPYSGENFGQVFKAVALKPIVPLQELCPGLNPALTSAVMHLLVRDRVQRAKDFGELIAVLREPALLREQFARTVAFEVRPEFRRVDVAQGEMPRAPASAITVDALVGATAFGETIADSRALLEHEAPPASTGVAPRPATFLGRRIRRRWVAAALFLTASLVPIALAIYGQRADETAESLVAPSASADSTTDSVTGIAVLATSRVEVPPALVPLDPAPDPRSNASPAASHNSTPTVDVSHNPGNRPVPRISGGKITPSHQTSPKPESQTPSPEPPSTAKPLPGKIVSETPF